MNYQVVIPVLISFAISVILGPDHHPVSEKTQDGTDRTSGRCAVAPEKSRNSYNGRSYFS